MRTINEANPLIIQHRKARSDDAPMPMAFKTYGEFLVAHRNWLREKRLTNKADMAKLFSTLRKYRETNATQTYSPMFAYYSKVIHMHKEYDAFLVRGIDATTRHIEGK